MIDELIRTLVVAGSPEPSSPELVATLARDCELVVACDRGADVCHAAGVVPLAFCGDADSVSPEGLAWVRQNVADQHLYPTAKDDTDLGLALNLARDLAGQRGGYVETLLTCATGGRLDHQLGVLGLMASHAGECPILVEDGFECQVLSTSGNHVWMLPSDSVGKTFSSIALREGTRVSEYGMEWELDHAPMELLGDRGVSNKVTSADARVVCHEGVVAAFLIN